MKSFFLLFIGLLLFSCGSVQVNGEGRFRIEKIGRIKENCEKFNGKLVTIKATYRGWNCPKRCGVPPVTRSDVCLEDETGCIYSLPFLSPLKDKGKEVLLSAKVKEKKGMCYVKPVRIYEVK